MSILMRKFLNQLRDQAGDGTDGGGGGGGGNADDDKGGQGGDGKGGDDKGGDDKGGKAGDDKGGKNTPSDAEAKLLKEVMTKKTALKEATDALTQANEKLKQFEGIDPEKIKKLLQDQSEAETKALEAKGNWDRLRERMAEEHGKQIKDKDDKLTQATEEIQKRDSIINELTIGNSFGNSKFIGEELTLTPTKARLIYGNHFDFVDGQVVGFDKPRGAASRTPYVDGKGDPVSFDEAMKKIVDADPDRDELTKSRMKKGAGSDTQKGDPPKKPTADLKGMSRIAKGLQKGVAK